MNHDDPRTYLLIALVAAVLLCACLLGGCSYPYLSPSTSAAIHDRLVAEELQKQTAEMQAQTALLRQIEANTRRTP